MRLSFLSARSTRTEELWFPSRIHRAALFWAVFSGIGGALSQGIAQDPAAGAREVEGKPRDLIQTIWPGAISFPPKADSAKPVEPAPKPPEPQKPESALPTALEEGTRITLPWETSAPPPRAVPVEPPASAASAVAAAVLGLPSPEPAAPAATATATATEKLSVTSSVQGENGEMLYSFRAENVEIKKALALFARANNLNIIPDPDVNGVITADLQNLPLEIIMDGFLDAHGFHWEERGGLIRVQSMETRIFSIDYPRLVRSGDGYSTASLGAGGSSSGSGGESGGGTGGGGGSSGGGASGGGSGGGAGGGSSGGGGTSITQQDNIDFWKELETQLTQLTSPGGRVTADKMSGLIQITDQPKVLDNIDLFLKRMQDRVRRQVDIEVKIYEVTLNDQFQLGVNWQMVVNQTDFNLEMETGTIVQQPFGGIQASQPAVVGTISSPESKYAELSAVIVALKEQGDVKAVSKPRIRSLNNQMSVIKVGTEQPFFKTNSGFVAGNGGSPGGTFENTSFDMITVGTILSITPQISDDDEITLDVSPVITSLVSIESAGGSIGGPTTTAPVLDVKQSSSLIRVMNGETIVIGGLIQEKTASSDRRVPLLGDIPLLGRAFRGTTEIKQNTELVIFLTPTIVE